jgi:hypothetical protein
MFKPTEKGSVLDVISTTGHSSSKWPGRTVTVVPVVAVRPLALVVAVDPSVLVVLVVLEVLVVLVVVVVDPPVVVVVGVGIGTAEMGSYPLTGGAPGNFVRPPELPAIKPASGNSKNMILSARIVVRSYTKPCDS